MHEDSTTRVQRAHQAWACCPPHPLEGMVWSALIHDGQVMPTQPKFICDTGKTLYTKTCDFVRFNQRNNIIRSPLADGFEIHAEIAIPRPRHRVRLFLAGAERDPDLSITHL